jgi:hypothetical protein
MKFKQFIFILLLALTTQALSAQTVNRPTDRSLEGLAGSVKRIDEHEAEIKIDGNLRKEGSKRFTRTLIFDRDGRISSGQTSLDNFDTTNFSYTYDKDGGRHIRSTRNDLKSPTSSASRVRLSLHHFTYEQKDNTLSQIVYAGDKPLPENLTQKYLYRFDTVNRILEKDMLTVAGEMVARDLYIYSDDQNPVERRLQAFGMTRSQIIKYSYDSLDAQGNWTKRTEENTLADENRTTRIRVTYRKITYY